MDRNHKEKEKEKASGLYADVVSPDQIRVGFIRFIESVGDLALHIPDILPPVFLARAKKTLPESSEGFQVILTVEKSYLWAAHHEELVENRLGGSTLVTVEEKKKQKKISEIL